MSLLVWLGLGIAGAGAIGTFVSFDRLADIERSEFPSQWRADGKPYGGKEARREASFVRSGLARSFLMQHWLDGGPAWAREHPVAQLHLRRMKLFNALTMAGILVAFCSALLGP